MKLRVFATSGRCGESEGFHPPQKKLNTHDHETHFFNAYDILRNEKESHMRENSSYILAQKKEKNDSLEGGVRKRAETEGKECWKKKERIGGCGTPHPYVIFL